MQCYNWFMAASLQRIEEEQFCVFRGICIFQFLKLSLCRMNEHILFRYSSLIISKLARGWAKNLKSHLQSRTHRGNILCINMLHWPCSFIWTQVNFLNLLCWMCLDEGMMKVQPATRQWWSFANLAELSLCPGRSWMQQQHNCTG